jgi:hypothetical protein
MYKTSMVFNDFMLELPEKYYENVAFEFFY